MQPDLTAFDTDNGTSQYNDTEFEPYTVFSGEIDGRMFNEITRHVTGYFDFMLVTLTSDAMDIRPVVSDAETDNAFLQEITIPTDKWDSFELSETDEYRCVISPYDDLYSVVKGTAAPDTVSITVDCTPDGVSQWEALQDHPLHDPDREQQNPDSVAIDTMTINGTSTDILRNPGYDGLDVDLLDLDSEVTVESMFDVKQWISNQDTDSESTVILVAVSSGPPNADTEYVLSFTAISISDWEVQDSLVLTGTSRIRSDTPNEISDVHVNGKNSWPDNMVKQCLPDAHTAGKNHRERHVTDIVYGFYHTDRLHGMVTHLLKDSLTAGEFTFELTTQFPLRVSHDLRTLDGINTDISVVNTIAPVISPDEL